jgi:hypothetical protein
LGWAKKPSERGPVAEPILYLERPIDVLSMAGFDNLETSPFDGLSQSQGSQDEKRLHI